MMLTIASLLALQTAPLVVEVLGVPPPPALAAADIIAAGRATFTARCQMCHGLDGNADTPVGRALKPPPQRFTDPLWQGRVTDSEIKKAIVEGGAAVKRSPAMPAFKDLAPATSLEPLVAFVRSLRATVAVVNVVAGDQVITATGVLRPDGGARIVVPGVTGSVTVLGIVDEKSLPFCSVDVSEAAGANITCAPSK